MLVSSARRWVQIHEARDGREAALPELLRRLSPCDLVIVEGYKRDRHPKLEVFRAANGRPPLHPGDPDIAAVASDIAYPEAGRPVLPLDDVAAIADAVIALAAPLGEVLARLEAHGSAQ